MLHFIRERAQGWVAWFIVGLISIPFALWGVNSYLTGPSDVVVATVNGEPIKQDEYKQAMQQYRDRMRAELKDNFNPAMLDSPQIKEGILDSLVDEKLLLSVGYDLGQRISDPYLASMIHATPAFRKDGQFDSSQYKQMLARASYTPERYENELRTDSIIQEFTRNIASSTLTDQFSVDNILRLEHQKREIAYGVVPAMSLLDGVKIEPEEVEAYYAINASNYLTPERVIVDYIELSVDDLVKKVEVDDNKLQTFYADNSTLFVGPEERKASHILIEGDDETAKATLQSAIERLAQGESFADLAKELSADVGSAQEGGDLGFFQRGVMDSAFEETTFSMQEGDVSDIVKTEFGHHLIKLTAIKAAIAKPFADVKDDVEKLYRNQTAEKLFYEQAELLADLSYENPDNLDVAAEDLGLEINVSSEFQRQNNKTAGLASNPKVVAAAFSEDVLSNDLNSAVIELTKSHLVVLHKNKYMPQSQLALDSVAPAITEQLRFKAAADLAKQNGEELISKLKEGAEGSSLFSGSNWFPAQYYARVEAEVSNQVLTHAFSTPKPSGVEAQYSGFTANNGNYIVLKISGVEEGKPETASDDERAGLESQLSKITGDSELKAVIKSLREEADIEIFDKFL